MDVEKNREEQPTRTGLAKDLAAVNDPVLNRLIGQAEVGYHHTYETPRVQLIADLQRAIEFKKEMMGDDGAWLEMLKGLLQAVVDGEYETTEEETQRWMVREGSLILEEGFRSDEEEGEHIGTTNLTNVAYLTRRLIKLWRVLLGDESVGYSRMDMMMRCIIFMCGLCCG